MFADVETKFMPALYNIILRAVLLQMGKSASGRWKAGARFTRYHYSL